MAETALRDGFKSLIRGMHGGVDSSILPASQYARGLNVSSRGGIIGPRPVWKEIEITDSIFRQGKFQGADVLTLNSADRLIFSVAGRIMGYNLETDVLTDYSGDVGIKDATVDRYYFVQADKFMIVQNTVTAPTIINDTDPDVARDADQTSPTPQEVPTGTKMAFGHGRLFLVPNEVGGTDAGERFFAAGNIMLPNNVNTLLSFTESEYLSGGGAFSLPNELGSIQGMEFLRNARSGTGLGSLIVFARSGASSFAVNAPREQWQNIDISQVLFADRRGTTGTLAPFTAIQVNNDLAYRSIDGIRTLTYSLTELSGAGTLSNNPISWEVQPFIDLDDEEYMPFMSAANVNNRFFVTANGALENDEVIFKGIISLDSSVITSLGREVEPAFDGIWTGLRFTHILSARKGQYTVLVAFAKDESGENRLFYLDETGTSYVDASSSRAPYRVYTREYDFSGEAGLQTDAHELQYVDLWLKEIQGEVDVAIYYRPEGYPLWNSMTTATVEAADGSLNQYRSKMRFRPSDTSVCDTSTNKPVIMASGFEFCIEITGSAKIGQAIFAVDGRDETFELSCDADSEAVDLQPGDGGFELDDFQYFIV